MTRYTTANRDSSENTDSLTKTTETDAFVALVGERVRAARQRKGISRRVLSELSDVSPRYLAQLEKGDGNISIALLYRIAAALDHRIEWLVGQEEPWTSDAMQVAELFRNADPERRRSVLDILQPEDPVALRKRRICLIGLRGAGKSTLGRLLGRDLAMPFLELNQEIEKLSGLAVNEVMALYGQEGYRRLERRALEHTVATCDEIVLAGAGGIVSDPETFHYLLRHFHTIWLKARPEEHMQRVRGQGDERPMAGNPKAMEELKQILTSRESLYAMANATVSTSGQSLERSRDDLRQAVGRLAAFAPASSYSAGVP